MASILSPHSVIVLSVETSPQARQVTTRQFRDNFFALMREVRETGCEVVVTNRGQPYARVMREIERSGGIIGCDKDILRITGEIPESITPAEEFYSVTDPIRVLDGETDWH